MDNAHYFDLLLEKLPKTSESDLPALLATHCKVIMLEKNEPLIRFQSTDRKMYFVAEGSFLRNIITSRGEEKTVMFHTESFCSFFKSYDTVYFNTKTTYEIKANERSVVLAFDYDYLYKYIQNDKILLQHYIGQTEVLFVTLDLFRNFQLGLTSEEYLKWLYENYRFLFQRFPGQNIASFMGITNVWLSNLKSKLTF